MKSKTPQILIVLLIPALVGATMVYVRRSRSPEVLLPEARQVLGTRRGSKRIPEIAAVLPESAEAQFLLGHQQLLDGEDSAADVTYKRAWLLGWPKEDVERERLILLSHRDFRKAEPLLQAVLDVNSEDRDALLALAMGYLNLDRLVMAERLLDKVLARDPNDGGVLTVRGNLRMKQGRVDLAIVDLQKAVSLGKDYYFTQTARFLLAASLRHNQRFEEAYEAYKECLAVDPDSVATLFGMGICAHRLGRADEAIQTLELVLKAKPSDIDTMLELARLHDERQEYDKALEYLRDVEARYPNEPQMLIETAKILRAKDDKTGADAYQARYKEIEKKSHEKGGPNAPEGQIAPP